MNLPERVPVMTLPSTTLFPQALLPLHIFETRYRQMLADMLAAERMFVVAMQQPDTPRESPCQVAGLGLIRVSVAHSDGTSHLILQGLTRVQLTDTVQTHPYRIHAVRQLAPKPVDNVTVDALIAKVHELVEERFRVGPPPPPFPTARPLGSLQTNMPSASQSASPKEILRYLKDLPASDQLADLVACALLPAPRQRQAILETVEFDQRLRRLIQFLLAEIEVFVGGN